MAYNEKFKPLPKNILDFGKLKLFTDKLDGGERRPSFQFRIIKGVLHAAVWTGVPTDIKNGYMGLKLDPKNFYSFMILFRDVLEGKLSSARINVEEKIWIEAEKKLSDELVALGSLKVAKDKKGLIYISLVIDKRPKIQFYFNKNFNAVLKKDDGAELTEAEYSQYYAQAYYMLIMDIVPPLLVDTADQIFDNKGSNSNNSNNFNNNNSNNNNNQNFEDFDDDIPY